MNPHALEQLLSSVRAGTLAVPDALRALREFPISELEDASLDTHRRLRVGFPEVVLGETKTDAQVEAIVQRLLELTGNVVVTRLDADRAERIVARCPHPTAEIHAAARILLYRREPVAVTGAGVVAVVAAGTSDRPVADEAALTAELMGSEVVRITDVGVAGIHRLLRHRETLRTARVFVVVAGMEGALPSVIAGLVGDRPVVAVPTSVGYGAAFGGLAPLLGMLNACAPGVTVVNIDNGFGAGYAAALMNRRPPAS